MEQSECSKFLGVLLDENLCWEKYIKYIESKITKNIGLLYRPKPFIDKHSLLSLYYSYIHPCINYRNIPWGSKNRTNLKKIYSQQKHATRIVCKKIVCHVLENSLSCVKFLMYIK